ncbi:MAG: hypothetical protein P4L33_10585 [Capsulimonadaceae bacterium]|nr:hypothetical protein [Capsulimonadaceae bacterium]
MDLDISHDAPGSEMPDDAEDIAPIEEIAPDPPAQEKLWEARLLAIGKEMRALGYTSVFLFAGDDRMNKEDGNFGHFQWNGNYYAALGMIERARGWL